MKDAIKKQYIEAFEALREAGKLILVALVLFLGGIIIGLTHPSRAEEDLALLKEIARQLYGKSTYAIIGTLFLRNSLSAVISVVLGPLLGIVPVLGALVNGLMVGLTFTCVGESNRITMLLQLLTHGIFELPAMFMAWGLGIWQGIWVFQKSEKPSFRERSRKALRIMVLVILPLLLIAAAIEGTSIHALMQK